MRTKSSAIFVFLIIVTSFCCCNFASSQIKTSGTRDYADLTFSSLPKTVVDAFFNHSVCKQVLVEPDYYVWCLSVIKWEGKYHAYYSRWNKKYGFEGWLTHSEVAHAVSSTPEGPFEFVNVVLQNQKKEGWDINNSHNPYAIVNDGRIYLYYISNDIKASIKYEKSKIDYPDSIWFVQNRTVIRNSQCIGIATADNPSGPFIRSGEAIVKPDNIKFKNIAVNPAVIHRNNKYTMIMKGDDVNHEEWFRIQLVGFSDKPSGPFDFALKQIISSTVLRRNFLGSATTAAVGLTIVPSHVVSGL